MKYKLFFLLPVILFLINCSSKKIIDLKGPYDVQLDTLKMYDKNRDRLIPVAFYKPKNKKKISNQEVIIFNHGYGANQGGDYLKYSYLTNQLASKGYFVVSIQHELPTDPLIPTDGKPQKVRMPFWERGTENILFVLNELKKSNPNLDYKHLTLMGHSNGGDMVALFGNKYPDLVYKIITMDNRRMYLPRAFHPKIYTLRSNDYPADEKVLPTIEEQKRYNIIVQNTSINHGKMDDKGNAEERKTLNNFIDKYLEEN
ncbi:MULTISPECIES: alpha/beta hydrolase [Chryseobacterium]|uniref:alpha/beta hydrolase n=1 Tax=Chryseobacterium TaxID=59732 RepID=UPI001BECC5B0|nr:MULTISPECIES: alpha/beta hydrolase [Chryseobacterium]MBT2619676.1 alpha/beta hydrolase [Chryseobacterium sp. ISL-6]